jgi:hypothetical protein
MTDSKAHLTEYDLKKQSQFAPARIGALSAIVMVYGDFSGPEQRENKANSKPNKANHRPLAGNPKLEIRNPTTPVL